MKSTILLWAVLTLMWSLNVKAQDTKEHYKIIYNNERILFQRGNPNSYLKQPFWYKLFDLPKHRKANVSFRGNLIQYYKDVVNNQPIPFPAGTYNQGGCTPGAAPLKFNYLIQKKEGDGIIDQIAITSNTSEVGPFDSDVVVYLSTQEPNIFPFGDCNQSELYIGRIHDSPDQLPESHNPMPLEYSYRIIPK